MVEYLTKLSEESDFLTFGPGETVLTIEDEVNVIQSKEVAKNQLMLCAFIEDKLVGGLTFTSISRPRVQHTGEFGVSVLKEYWGLGIATNLLNFLLEWARDGQIIRKINLRVRSDHQSAIQLYQKFGFVQEGLETRGLNVGGRFYDFVHMGLHI
jgi:RimJ/RimL family protein N-acetyltransferase